MAIEFTIRAATASDAREIAKVHVDSWRTTYQGLIDNTFLETLSVEKRQEMWTKVLEARVIGDHLLVAECARRGIVGFVSGGPNRDRKSTEHEDSAHANEPDSEIYAIYLLAEVQKLGLGRRLFLSSLQRLEADGFYGCKVWVLKDNPTAGFYKRFGGIAYQEKMCPIGGASYLEEGYRWDDLSATLREFRPGHRHGAIQHFSQLTSPDDSHYPNSNELLSVTSSFSRFFDFTRLGIHHEALPPGRRTSWPHAESTEDEFAYVLSGTPDVWIDGVMHRLGPGDGVGFKAGSGITHTFVNNTDALAQILVIGDRNRPDNQCYYAVHHDRNEAIKVKGFYWENHPVRRMTFDTQSKK